MDQSSKPSGTSDTASSQKQKPVIPEKPKHLSLEKGDLAPAAVESPNYPSKPRTTKEPPPIPSRPQVFTKKPLNLSSEKGSFALRSSEDFAETKTATTGSENLEVAKTRNAINSQTIAGSDSTSFLPSQQFTPTMKSAVASTDMQSLNATLQQEKYKSLREEYESVLRKTIKNFRMEENMEAKRRKDQEMRWGKGSVPSGPELKRILEDRKSVDEEFKAREAQAISDIEAEFQIKLMMADNSNADQVKQLISEAVAKVQKEMGELKLEGDEVTPTPSQFSINKIGNNVTVQAFVSSIKEKSREISNDETFSVSELGSEFSTKFVADIFAPSSNERMLQAMVKELGGFSTPKTSSQMTHADTKLDEEEEREREEALLMAEIRASEIPIPNQLPESPSSPVKPVNSLQLHNSKSLELTDTAPAKPKMAFSYVRIYDYNSNLYKTMVIKPATTVKDLLTNALKKSNNSDTERELSDYHVIESLTTGDSRVMDLNENMMNCMLRFSDPTIGVFFYFRKGLSTDRVNPIQYFEKAMDESRKMDEKQRLASQKLGSSPKASAEMNVSQTVQIKDSDTTPTNSVPNLNGNEMDPRSFAISKDCIKCTIYRYKTVGIKGWKKRFMVLEPNFKRNLLFFRDEKESISNEKYGALLDINIGLIESVVPTALEADNVMFSNCGFAINTNESSIYLLALNKEMRDNLIEVLDNLKMIVKAKFPNLLNPPSTPVAILLTPSINDASNTGSMKVENTSIRKALTNMMTSSGTKLSQNKVFKARIILMDRKVNELTETEYDVFRGFSSNSFISFMEEKGLATASKLTPLLRGLGASSGTGASGGGSLGALLKAALNVNERKSSNSNALFGVSLESLHDQQDGGGQPSRNPWAQLVRSTRQHSNHLIVPKFFEVAIQNLLDRGLNTSGIFRIPGSRRRMDNFKKAIEEGNPNLHWDEISVHDVAGLVKMYLRELPEPLLTYKFYKLLVSLEGVKNDSEKVSAIKSIMYLLPKPHRHLLECLVSFLAEIAKYSDRPAANVKNTDSRALAQKPDEEEPKDAAAAAAGSGEGNRMNSDNLAVVIGPNVLRGDKVENDSTLSPSGPAMPTTLSPQAAVREMENIRTATWVLKLLIDNASNLWTIPRETMERVMNSVTGEEEG